MVVLDVEISPGRFDMIYLDNAATSWPKPDCVAAAMSEYLTHYGIGLGRSLGTRADQIRATIDTLRRDLASMLRASSDEIVLTNSATDGLNLVIQGLLLHRFGAAKDIEHRPADSTSPALVVTTQIEHQSVLRPLHAWVRRGWIRLEILPCDPFGNIDWTRLDQWLEERPLLVCVNHASNVTGAVQRLTGLGQRCREHGAMLLIDAAQTLGWLPIDVESLQCDFLLAAGHKSLHGPLGTGIAYLRRERQDEVDSLRLGGTGDQALEPNTVDRGPSKWEGGNVNVPGLIGLAAAVRAARSAEQGAPVPDAHATVNREGAKLALGLASHLWGSLAELPEVTRVADPGYNPFTADTARLPIISLTVANWDPASLALALDSAAGLVTRAGYHCAPLIHAALGTTDSGTLRVSLGPYNTMEHVECFRETLERVCRF